MKSTRSRQLVAGLASTFVLVVLLVGVPVLLVLLHGRPDQPTRTFAALAHLIGGQAGSGLIVDLVSVAAWIAWVIVTVAIIVELSAWTRGRPTPEIRGVHTVQPWVRQLVATATLLIGTVALPARTGAATTAPTAVATVTRPAPTPAPAETPTVVTPIAVAPTCVVVPRDTLWGIAETQLGNPLRWREIYKLNHGLAQPGGRALEDPGIIIPGWTLRLPADATPPQLPAEPAPPTAPAPVAVASPPTAVPSTGPTRGPVAAATSNTSPKTNAVTTEPKTPSAANAVHHRRVAPVPRTRGDQTRIPVSAIAATGIVALIAALRTAWRRRQRPIPRTAPSAQRVETGLRRAANTNLIGRLDAALRAFGTSLRTCGLDDVRILAVRRVGEEVEILVDTPLTEPPAGFETAGDPRGWITIPTITTEQLVEFAGGGAAPAPCLISLGTIDDEACLIDLETAALLTIDGDTDDEVRSVMRHIAVELATSPLADHLDILVVGEPVLAPLADTHPRIRSLDLVAAVDELETVARFNQDEHDTLDENSVDTNGVEPGDLAVPTVLVSFQPIDEQTRRRIETIVAARHGRAAAVFPSPDHAGWHAELDAGRVRVAPLGLVLEPFTITTELADDIEALIAPPPATVEVEESVVAPAVSPAVPPVVSIAPYEDPPFDLEVRVLGPVEVAGIRQPFARHRHLEIAVYLALHPDGVSDERLKTALWADAAPTTSTFNTAISSTRAPLGRDAHGEPHLEPFVDAGRTYRVGKQVTSDWHRFTMRLEHALHADQTTAIRDLRDALALVRGQPFAESHGFEWAWSEGLIANMELTVARAAHQLATWCLETGDTDGAIWAAMQGLVAAPADETLYRDRMRAHDHAGNPAGIETVMSELQHAVEDIEPWDAIHPETVALYQQLIRGRRRSAGSR